ncbi:MAG: deoxyribose-phosphate aldolase [Bacteroidetes bacterium]|nr:deoxyribose-phosphate aldolase [Bacteroidota bacterium]
MEFAFDHLGNITEELLLNRANDITAGHHQMLPADEQYKLIFTCIDHTTLDGLDHDEKVDRFCRKVAELGRSVPSGLKVASVCVYPVFVRAACNALKDTGINVASVAGAFPSGQSPLHLRLQEAAFALDHGAAEIDMVISRGRLISGDYSFVYDEIASFREVCGKAVLKVILETGELKEPLLIARAGEIALRAGADFLKTSTGKTTIGATLPAALIMLDCIKAYYLETGKKAGLKPSGGISEPGTAIQYLLLLHDILGNEWLTPRLFRIGASRLTEKVAEILKSI